MKKNILFSISLTIFSLAALAQGSVGVAGLVTALSQRSTVLYSDTVFEVDGLKFKVTETYAFRDKVKTTLILTNQTDQFKILHSDDITIMNCDSAAIVINKKPPLVVAPHSHRKFGLMAEGKNFKLYDIRLMVKQIYTGTEPIPIPSIGLFNLHREGIYTTKSGPLEITSIKCGGAAGGTTRAYFKLSYTGDKLLGIHGQKAMLLTADKRAYPNSWPKSKYVFYPKERASYNVLLEFENPQPNFVGEYCDKVSFENVFTEYTLSSNNKPFEFHVYKNGIQDDDEPKEKKEKEKEDSED